MSIYYTRLCIAEIRFDLLSIGYDLSDSDSVEEKGAGEKVLEVVKKLDEFEQVVMKKCHV
ncbi:hypothetical protein [Bacillus sp. JCM 19041]|uniref:hypothetical protein n=1 Tax=Bacillus sp. JCM 19041 TaxID=1460637 RepID=UPI0006CF4664